MRQATKKTKGNKAESSGSFSRSDVGYLLDQLREALETAESGASVDEVARLLSEAISCIEYQRAVADRMVERKRETAKELCQIAKLLTEQAAKM